MKALITIAALTSTCFAATPSDPWDTKPHTVREMTTDRPDQTEGAFTIPKGMFQIESGLVNYSRRLDTDHRNETMIFGEMNVKYGVTDSLDFQLIWQPYTTMRYKGNTEDADNLGFYREGVNDLVVRLKYNVIGNDGGAFAMSLLPFVKVPTAKHRIGNDMWEGGLAVNTEIDLGGGFTLGNSLFATIAADSDDTLYFRPAVTAVLGYGITERLSCYVEIFSASQVDVERYWQTSLDAGLGFAITPNMIFDVGANWFFRGDEAINPFVGLSVRF
jgi:hypothetical protein